jgi:hypothetical protein
VDDPSYQINDGKVIIRLRDRICDTSEELLSSGLFAGILNLCIADLSKKNSKLLGIFASREITAHDISLLIETFKFLIRLPSELVPKVVPGSEQFFRDRGLFNDFVEYIYNYWRSFQRLIICDSEGDRFDTRPYRTFNRTTERLTHLVRGTYRDLQESISGNHPRIYRQVRAGAEIATIALPVEIQYPNSHYSKLNSILIVRQVLIYPPLIFTPPMNKRTGKFERIDRNPLEDINLRKEDWLCYPARVGPLLVMVYFSLRYFELGFSLSNLFEMADEEDLKRKPDAIYLFGVPESDFPDYGGSETVFYDDEENQMLVAAIPDSQKFGYFGYLKKMILTLHNIKMMKQGRLPFHGALVNLAIRDRGNFTVLILGDTGAGKSETLEALRLIGDEKVDDITIIADDMGSLQLDAQGKVVGYGSETGAFVRLDDLTPGYAFGQIDRTIIMSPDQTNARVVIPVTTYAEVVRGYPIDYILYANNYDTVDDEHPTIERFYSPEDAISVFREGAVMSKGTTTSTGKVSTYFANVFGPDQYQTLHETLAKRYFDQFFAQDIYVGQIRTQLGIQGMEREGPDHAARGLLDLLSLVEA